MALELAQFPVTAWGRSGVLEVDSRARLSLDFVLLLQRVVVSSDQELNGIKIY